MPKSCSLSELTRQITPLINGALCADVGEWLGIPTISLPHSGHGHIPASASRAGSIALAPGTISQLGAGQLSLPRTASAIDFHGMGGMRPSGSATGWINTLPPSSTGSLSRRSVGAKSNNAGPTSASAWGSKKQPTADTYVKEFNKKRHLILALVVRVIFICFSYVFFKVFFFSLI